MEAVASEVSGLMKTLSNRRRLLILCRLAEGERSVGELADELGLTQPAMSQQLSLLRRDGLVETRRDGQAVCYSLPRGKPRDLVRFLHRTWCG